MKRFRLQTDQTTDGKTDRQVSSVILSEEEARQNLTAEGLLHHLTGWVVTITPDRVVCGRGNIIRIISIQSFDAMNDYLST